MNLVKNEKLENNSHELQFSIDAEAFNAAIAKAFKREAGKYNIPGFRKGKAPRHMIEKMFGADVFHYDAINDLFPEAYEAAVAESGIEPVDHCQARDEGGRIQGFKSHKESQYCRGRRCGGRDRAHA